ncbi:hypothetical protein M440DRAFT_1045136 [Trichoderma longibrachiatum ATCC 18648]|uniref:Uncharacterized protein n=1 Tax=Trichoderma longibrachiatum ATCC 18648 TaxID=983965 RepID=A0A2T4BYI1_TRILO|nr:hypothetical protein M440DRAFT_1045136 [Trichoderma longibrachiatum ATCC 18648]
MSGAPAAVLLIGQPWPSSCGRCRTRGTRCRSSVQEGTSAVTYNFAFLVCKLCDENGSSSCSMTYFCHHACESFNLWYSFNLDLISSSHSHHSLVPCFQRKAHGQASRQHRTEQGSRSKQASDRVSPPLADPGGLAPANAAWGRKRPSWRIPCHIPERHGA